MGVKFGLHYNLTAHELIHSLTKMFQCNECGKSFVRKATLQHHLLIHSGAKPVQCPHCPKRFRQRATYLRHEARYHPGVSGSGLTSKDTAEVGLYAIQSLMPAADNKA